jgi:hypothetical protein
LAKTAIRVVPRELTHASIYLDDLFEIENIFSERFEKLNEPMKVTFEYTIDGDLKMTTRQGLIEHGGQTSSFQLYIVIERPSFQREMILQFYESLKPSITFPYELRDQAWPIYAQVEQILRSREGKLKKLAGSLSRSGLYSTYGALSALGAIGLPSSLVYVWARGISVLVGSLLFVYLLFFIPVFILVRAAEKNDRLYLHFIREKQKQKRLIARNGLGRLSCWSWGRL